MTNFENKNLEHAHITGVIFHSAPVKDIVEAYGLRQVRVSKENVVRYVFEIETDRTKQRYKIDLAEKILSQLRKNTLGPKLLRKDIRAHLEHQLHHQGVHVDTSTGEVRLQHLNIFSLNPSYLF